MQPSDPLGPRHRPATEPVGRKRILVAEDEARIASFVRQGLCDHGFEADIVADGPAAYQHAVFGGYDLMVLDLGLPGADGFTVLRRLRAAGCAIPVIILTARGGVDDTVAGLEGGADDYMSKPFQFSELLARVRLRLRDEHTADTQTVRCCRYELEPRTRTMIVDGRPAQLTDREYTLAEVFLRNCGRVLTREELLTAVWDGDAEPASNVVDVYVRYLRRKVGTDLITTIRGKGYRLENRDPWTPTHHGPGR